MSKGDTFGQDRKWRNSQKSARGEFFTIWVCCEFVMLLMFKILCDNFRPGYDWHLVFFATFFKVIPTLNIVNNIFKGRYLNFQFYNTITYELNIFA